MHERITHCYKECLKRFIESAYLLVRSDKTQFFLKKHIIRLLLYAVNVHPTLKLKISQQ
jgi:hypothetical protein